MNDCIKVYTAICVVLIFCIKWYFRKIFCTSPKRLDGKTCVVTGGTSGIGLEIAKDLAKRGARVIIACPFENEGTNAQKTIIEETGNVKVIFKHLDLASLESTRKFAQSLLETENRLDILINNAGITRLKKRTADNFNITMQVNYYGHFLLTILLLPLLKKSGTPTEKSRIVNTTSLFSLLGTFKPGKMNLQVNWWSFGNYYPDSKLSMILMSTELTKRLKGQNVTINSADPGLVGTDIYKSTFGKLIGSITIKIVNLLFNTPREGAQTALHVALAEELNDVSGEYFRNCTLCRANTLAYDKNLSKLLWEESVELVKLNDFELHLAQY